MIHGNGLVTALEKHLTGVEKDVHLGFTGGQGRWINLALMFLQPRDVGEAVQGDPVRFEGNHVVHRPPKTLDALMRQAVNQIKINRIKSQPPALRVKRLDLRGRLRPMDRLKDLFIEILNA